MLHERIKTDYKRYTGITYHVVENICRLCLARLDIKDVHGIVVTVWDKVQGLQVRMQARVCSVQHDQVRGDTTVGRLLR